MSDIIELSSLDFNEDLSRSSTMKSTNFGGGIELLMNDKIKENGNKQYSDIDIEDLNNLENELNNLSDVHVKNTFIGKSDLFSSNENSKPEMENDKHSVRFDDVPNIAQFTAETQDDKKTWDGYGKFNNVPVNPDKHPSIHQPQMSKEELLREKFKYLRKLETLEKKGVELSKKYTMESNLAEMQGEYETIMEEKSKQNSMKFQGNMMMAIINGVEFLNNRFDPFDVKLDGWGEQINENINDYDEIFGELYEKYKSRASMAPELKLLFQLGGSAMMVHMTNTMFKSSMPGMDDILRQNPDLMRQFQTAAVNSLGQTNPGFGGFMNGIMNPEPSIPAGRGPPPAMNTQSRQPMNNYSNRPEFNPSRPDLNMGRPDFNAGKGSANYVDDGINFREKTANSNNDFSKRRPEMKGPSELSDILSGLKTKTINIKDQSHNNDINTNNNSTISISDLKDLQTDGSVPKRSKRRKSDKNTVSLDI
jgi:hypothetical protein